MPFYGRRRGYRLVVIALMLFAGCDSREAPSAKQGVMDLGTWSPSDLPLVPLRGEWDFYWKRLYRTDELTGTESAGPKYYLNLPAIWNGYIYGGERCSADGFATFRLRIVNIPGDDYALMVKELDTSYRVFVNGELLETTGVVGVSSATSEPHWERKIVPFYAEGEADILLHISNFHHRKGGPEELIYLGKAKDVTRRKFKNAGMEAFIAGSLFIMAMYHLSFFLLRRKEVSSLFYSLVCLVTAFIDLFCTGERLLIQMFPRLDWEIAVKVEYLSIPAAILVFLLFIKSVFASQFNKIAVVATEAAVIVLAVFIVATPVRIFSHSIVAIQILGIAGIGYLLFVLIVSMLHKVHGSFLFFAASVVFAMTVVNDTLYNNMMISSDYYFPYGLFVFIFAQSFILLQRFTNSMKNEEALREDLVNTNISFKRFVPTEFIEFLNKESISDVQLGDQVETEMSILFSDIRSFTSISEAMSPEENFNFLNQYLKSITPAITSNNGFIDKYIGDSIMALFPESAEDAVKAAIELHGRLVGFNDTLEGIGQKRINIGVGIHTGNLMLGTIGNKNRMETTVISDAVNLASRLEDLTKIYGANIIISRDVFIKMENPGKKDMRFLGNARIKGKKESIPIFEIFESDPEPMKELKLITHTEFEKAIEAYLVFDFDLARSLFRKVLKVNPQDGPARYFSALCDSAQS